MLKFHQLDHFNLSAFAESEKFWYILKAKYPNLTALFLMYS